ncbi:MAG: DUF438 domain-containing protein, partial [Bacteroidales bacterium]|nr:DUF438 domain-containing protein [Bacteroidales bacterium]
MSEFTNHNELKINKLLELSEVIINKQKPAEYVKANMDMIEAIMPSDVIRLVHLLVEKGYEMKDLKKHISKLLNLFYKALSVYPTPKPSEDDLLFYLQQNSEIMMANLNALKPVIKALNLEGVTDDRIKALQDGFTKMNGYSNYFTVKENLLFPIIEKKWDDYKCVHVMWSIHDDIRGYIKRIPALLSAKNFDLKEFNVISSKLYFDLGAIVFRDNKILFPQMLITIPKKDMEEMLIASSDLEFPFIKPEVSMVDKEENNEFFKNGNVNLGTGAMSPEQISMVFNHLPVDITYVDENDTVKYFSTPKHRIFPRTTAIIGRQVSNCHPPESVHVVEDIVDAFRKGEKDDASFWIHMGPKFVLIRYFAVRDDKGGFRGTLEVSQEISEIQELKGDKRLLEWE